MLLRRDSQGERLDLDVDRSKKKKGGGGGGGGGGRKTLKKNEDDVGWYF